MAKETPAWETSLIKAFGVHQCRYGTHRLQVELRQNGHAMGRQYLRTAMRSRHLRALQFKVFAPRTTDSTHGQRTLFFQQHLKKPWKGHGWARSM